MILVAALSLLASAIFVLAAVTDIAERRIPNGLVLAMLVLAALRILDNVARGGGLDAAVVDLALGLAVFLSGALAFHFRLLGGGDVKLLAAGVLWTGSEIAGPFLLATAMAGGVLGVVFLIRNRLFRTGGHADAASKQASLPYGVAIALGGIVSTALVS
jgi:prepilin peptidase CpaA